MQGLGLARGYRETERARECFGTIKVGLLEFEPGQVGDFDRRVDRAAGVFASVRTVLAVEVGVPVDREQVVSQESLLWREGLWLRAAHTCDDLGGVGDGGAAPGDVQIWTHEDQAVAIQLA